MRINRWPAVIYMVVPTKPTSLRRAPILSALVFVTLFVTAFITPGAVAAPGDDECAGGVDAPEDGEPAHLAFSDCDGELWRSNTTAPDDLYDAYKIRVEGRILTYSYLDFQVCKDPDKWLFYNLAYRSDLWIETSKDTGMLSPGEGCTTPEPVRYNSSTSRPGVWFINIHLHENGLQYGQGVNYTIVADVLK